ncbi:MAG: sigma-54-dependent Fis family transcriptional regulator [Candidatus Omnitrophica bacterium]|nr:Regulatory protein AtoC [bacterium]NUN96885.1 sigma-54-dependent Fis family transcriptional regulator [Candidatus Omnitrophota bacterium]
MPKVLIVDDEPRLRKALGLQLEAAGYDIETAEDGAVALGLLQSSSHDCVISDLRMPNLSGEELLAEVQRVNPSLPVILLTAHGTVQVAVRAMQEGAVDFIEKPYNQEDMLKAVRRAIDRKRLVLENLFLREELSLGPGQIGLVGESAPMKTLFTLIERVARSEATTLILGESGVGKELVARAIHNLSGRAQNAFVPINCIAIPEELLESTLFGHVKGAFTGAVQNRVGSFELADRGTIFLDEIGDMNLGLQGKILRVLQEQTIEPVGGRGSKRVDVRVVAATNRNLAEEVRAGRFREDLYFRLNVVPIEVPPLRNHPTDIPVLVAHFLKQLGKDAESFRVPTSVQERLMKYEWPGNVRELRNVVERAVVLDSPELLGQIGGSLAPPPEIVQPRPPEEAWVEDESITYKEAKQRVLDAFEKRFFGKTLERHRGNVTRTAEALGMHRKNLQEKLDRLGLNPKDFSEAGEID